MSTIHSDAEILRNILENRDDPQLLDCHPWVSRSFVKDTVARNQHLQKERPGQQLLAALAELFLNTMPGTPPRRGKRLDNHWGEFGILAAQYFAPLQFGAPVPSSLRDAWGRIDQAILLYVYGDQTAVLSERDAAAYKLVGDEPEVAATSTLSDWQRKGIQRLADAIPAREKYLGTLAGANSSSEQPAVASAKPLRGSPSPGSIGKKLLPLRNALLPVLTLLLLIALAFGGYKARAIYGLALTVRGDMSQLQGLKASATDLTAVTEAGPLLSRSRQDFEALVNEVEPMVWLGPWLGWVPVYGGDLASGREILDMADLLLESTETAYVAFQPLMTTLQGEAGLDPAQLAFLLNEAQPELIRARRLFDQAVQLRAELNLARLSPQTRALIEDTLDTLMPVMDDGLTVAMALPHFLGAASDGPKTYLLLVQNEDELRPTGGFITAVGTLVVQDGQVLRLTFVDSGELDNWERPYPLAPWQLDQYMNSPVLVLRDSNWFPDFPTSALYAESLYAYSYSHSVDGVIAFDQHMLVLILEALGPLMLEGEPEPIGAGNVIAFMRSSKSPPAGQPLPAGWSRKGFMDRITKAILVKIFQGQDISWEKLGKALFQGLDQDHLLLQLDDAALAQVIARHGWDGALTKAEEGDFLMVVDTNIGFNKTNAVVAASLSYDVDLSDPAYPVGTLTVTHHNNASSEVACLQWGGQRSAGQEQYPIDACYWNYMRVYVPSGTKLLEATPQDVSDEWMILNHGVSGPVDVLEEVDGLQAFGTLLVVPGGESLVTSFQFRLPEDVLAVRSEAGSLTYRLQIDKQPGTLAVPLVIRIHFPGGAGIQTAFPGAVVDGNQLLIETDLRTDLDLEVNFQLK
jgi:hypothetical protein